MARRRHKKRTHVEDSEDAVDNTPKSMVIKLTRRGNGTGSLSQLVRDVRQLMQPHTAIRLRERSTNKLRDFVSMTGPLGVSHLMVFPCPRREIPIYESAVHPMDLPCNSV